MMRYILILILSTSLLIASIGKVRAMKGSATLKRAGKTISVKTMQEIYEEDQLLTEKKARVQIILNDDTVITIGSNSSYTFNKFDKENNSVEMYLDRGFFRVITGKIGRIAPQKFKIATKNATMGIRGTQFMASITKKGEEIDCIQGSITVTNLDKTVIVNAGDIARLQKDGTWKVGKIVINKFYEAITSESDKALEEEPEYDELPTILDDYLIDEIITQVTQPFDLDITIDNSTNLPAF